MLTWGWALSSPEKAWGADARAFRLDREADQHGAYGMAWAHAANDKGKANARGCPGMGLSIRLIEAFVGALIAERHRWRVPKSQNGAYAYGGALERTDADGSAHTIGDHAKAEL